MTSVSTGLLLASARQANTATYILRQPDNSQLMDLTLHFFSHLHNATWAEWYGCLMGSNTDAPLIRARMSHCTVSQHSSSYLQCQRPACGRVDEMSTGRVSLWAMSFRPLSLSLLLGQSMSLIITASLWYGCDCVHI